MQKGKEPTTRRPVARVSPAPKMGVVTPSPHKGLSSKSLTDLTSKRLTTPSSSVGTKETPKRFQVEDTPASLSRHSSLSSIGGESVEDALVRNCINQGIPKGPPSRIPRQAESKKLHKDNAQTEKTENSNECGVSSQQERRESLGYANPSRPNQESRLDDAVLAEALRVARDVSDDVSLMTASITSACLDNINPPSAMESLLSLSSASIEDNNHTYVRLPNNNRKLECRHSKKVPHMVRRALGEQEMNGDGCQSMASSCHSNLDNIFPPSLVGGNGDDMESSMISVASITSEVCDKDSPPSNGTSSLNTQVILPARQIASLLMKEANLVSSSSVTLFLPHQKKHPLVRKSLISMKLWLHLNRDPIRKSLSTISLMFPICLKIPL